MFERLLFSNDGVPTEWPTGTPASKVKTLQIGELIVRQAAWEAVWVVVGTVVAIVHSVTSARPY